jgi:ABC-type transporter Mla subunit MlaD
MPDDVFRIVITVAVALASLAFLVQAGVAIALYRVVGRMQRKVFPLADRAEATLKDVGPVIAKVGPALDRVGPVLTEAQDVLNQAKKILSENQPRIGEITAEGVAIAKSSRRQVDRIGELLNDAGGRAKERLEQIDRSVDSTVENLEHAGDAMKRAVMRPMREVNGLAAGISAVVSTLVHGTRRPSVDAATQDEEMFI